MIRSLMMLALSALCACQHDASSASTQATPPPAAQSPGSAAASDLPADQAFILPGAYSERTTLAELQASFGASNVKIIEAPPDDEGFVDQSVVLFPDDPSRRAFFEFYDPGTWSHLASIRVRDAGSRWRGKLGVHIGMSFAQLRKLNRTRFSFTGFDDEQRGQIHDQWSSNPDEAGGGLGEFDVGEDDHLYFEVALGLRAEAKDIPVDAYPHLDPENYNDPVDSDDPRYPRLDELVVVTGFGAGSSLDDEWD